MLGNWEEEKSIKGYDVLGNRNEHVLETLSLWVYHDVTHYGNTNSHLFEERIEEEELLEYQGRDKPTILQCLQGTFRLMTAKEKWHDTTHALRK